MAKNHKPKVSKNSDDNWRNDAIQFPRLIAELETVGAFDPETVAAVGAEMGLDPDEVFAIVSRAQKAWDEIKARTP